MRARGFTLIELLVAATVSVIVVLGAFLAVTGMQKAATRHEQATELISQARVAMELLGRDLRAAGDSVDRFPTHCIAGFQHAGTAFRCGAILEPHPWRVAIARNSWTRGVDGIAYTMDDQPPTGAFDAEPENAVAYQFVPRSTAKVDLDGSGRQGVIGRLERVVNPYRFGGQAP